MRIRRTGHLATAMICMLSAGVALAADDDEFTRKGYYVAAGASYGFEMLDSSPFGTLIITPLTNDNSFGMNLRAGNRVKSWLAFEIQYEWMDGFDINQATGSAALATPGTVAVYNPDITTVNAKFLLPIWRAQPYLLVGGGLASYDIDVKGAFNTLSTSSNGFAFRGGAGVDAYITRHLVVFAEGTYVINTDSASIFGSPTITIPTFEQLYYVSVSAGLAYRF